MTWDYALTDDTGTLPYNLDTRRFNMSDIGAELSTTCRSVSLETLYTPLRWNALIFDIIDSRDMDVWILLARLESFMQVMQYELRLGYRIVRRPHILSPQQCLIESMQLR